MWEVEDIKVHIKYLCCELASFQMWMRTLHKIFITGEVIRKQLTPFLAHWEKYSEERNIANRILWDTTSVKHKKRKLKQINPNSPCNIQFYVLIIILSCSHHPMELAMWKDLIYTHPPLIFEDGGYQMTLTINRKERWWTNCPSNLLTSVESKKRLS